MVLAAGCDSSGAVTTTTSTAGNVSSATRSPPSPTSSTQVSGLRSEFLAWIAPVDGDAARLGWEAYELPAWRMFWSAQADCWDQNGFGDFSDALRTVQPDYRSTSGRLLPDMARYRDSGFWRESEWTLGPKDVAYASTDESWLKDVLSLLPEGADYGVGETDIAAAHAVGVKCEHAGQDFLDTVTGLTAGDQWLFRLDEVEREPEVAALIEDNVLPCLRYIDPEFEDAESIDGWLATQFGRQATLDTDPDTPRDVFEQKMIYWGQSYAACMEPLVEARREPRLAAREEWVDQKFTELLQLESDVDDFLAGGPH
jgi:hypothetical protein